MNGVDNGEAGTGKWMRRESRAEHSTYQYAPGTAQKVFFIRQVTELVSCNLFGNG